MNSPPIKEKAPSGYPARVTSCRPTTVQSTPVANNGMIAGYEASVLAYLMTAPDGCEKFLDRLPRQIFSVPHHRKVSDAIRQLHDEGEAVNHLTVANRLHKKGQLDSCGGRASIIDISCQTTSEQIAESALDCMLDNLREREAMRLSKLGASGQMSAAELHEKLGEVSSLNLSKSLGRSTEPDAVDDFPQALSEVAFHGLAGDIVRRIEPHTEADSVALLFQCLVAFGNVIGRAAHAVADGSQHYTNLYGVLVGESSKSRKGTSWNRIINVFEYVDDQWQLNCLANGLSSGEGLIWAVRDAITKDVPLKEKGKFTGEVQSVVVDSGVADKRLCVTESEYAQVLKVMTREGNTLSAIIRAAWETGRLRSMTKNSPARATGAHISIIGHITCCELRRLLTETESANGFGNRFMWLAVRRSKCLPEGGGVINVDDLLPRIRGAVEFARSAGVVMRDDGARELWRACYPDLSEGKPGLLGAITGRAEAQVLRLSVLYALLDCSTKISVEHHRAALALWNYAERSVKWIFGVATGDKNADRILLALRAVGTSGLTRKQILDDLFQRNVSGTVLDAALQSLRRSKLAFCRTEPTGGKPRERWFVTKPDTP